MTPATGKVTPAVSAAGRGPAKVYADGDTADAWFSSSTIRWPSRTGGATTSAMSAERGALPPPATLLTAAEVIVGRKTKGTRLEPVMLWGAGGVPISSGYTSCTPMTPARRAVSGTGGSVSSMVTSVSETLAGTTSVSPRRTRV